MEGPGGWSPAELRAGLGSYVERPLGSALRSLGVDLVAYALTLWVALSATSWWVQGAAGLGVGLVATNLFMIGHDAAHGSFTHCPRLNAAIARLTFIACFHPTSAWRHVHHDVHHRSVNAAPTDVVWRPLGVTEFRRCSPRRRAWYRLYRTTPGLGLYYLVELWGRELMGGAPTRRQPRGLLGDRLGIVVVILGWVVVGVSSAGPWLALCLTIVPMLVLCWAIGFVVFFNHTHPRIPWATREGVLSQPAAQVTCSVRLVYPRMLAPFLGNVMEHTAHHVHPGVPLVNLGRAQEHLRRLVGDHIVEQRWSPKVHRHILRTCRLYDGERQLWLDWDGRPTAATFLARRSGGDADALGTRA